MMMATSLLLGACATSEQADQATGELIGKSDIQIQDGRMTAEALWAFGRIGDYQVSPDGKQIAYTVGYYSVPQNKSNREIFVMNADGSGNQQITHTPKSESNVVWIKGGTKIAFLSSESGSSQVWEMNPDGSGRQQLTHFDKDIEGFAFSPDERHLLFIAQVKTVPSTQDKYPDLDKTTGIIVTDLMYKHWDEWVTTAPHPFVADFDGNQFGEAKDLLEGQPYESPMKPFGGIEQLAWSPASDKVAYTCRAKTGLAYAISTDSDIYEYDLASGSTTNLCKATANSTEMGGYDTNPQYSPDGKYIAWQSMARDGYESDRNRLCVYELATGKKNYVSDKFDSNVEGFVWNKDSKSLSFIGVWHGTLNLYQANFKGEVKQITNEWADYGSISLANNGNKLLATKASMSHPTDIYIVTPGKNAKSTKVEQITRENDHILSQLNMGKCEQRWVKTTDGKQMLVWIMLPANFEANKKYPTLLFCEGGPQSPVSQFWSYRWNIQIMAANGYVVVLPNRRGLPGFGSAWNEEISGDWTGQCMNDYLSAIDDATKNLPYVDKDRLGCVGASFGGFSVYYLAGHHDKRFKAFLAHDGAFNLESMYTDTEEAWFSNWEYDDAYWNKDQSANAKKTYENSPHKFVDKWDTPILCIHGEKDYRINANQGMGAFNAARMRGIPAELLIYPDENHWVLKPQNGVLWQRTFFGWLDKWLKK